MKRFRLTELEPEFVTFKNEDGARLIDDATRETAHGLRFLCPLCFEKNGGNVGTHSVICWFEDKVGDDVTPGPGRWKPEGDTLETLSFVPGKHSRSIQLLGGCNAHFFITNGEVHE